MEAGLCRGTIRENGNHDDVAIALAEGDSGFALFRCGKLLAVLRVFAGREIAGERVERLEQSMERAGGDKMHVWLVHVVLLDALEDLAVAVQRALGLSCVRV